MNKLILLLLLPTCIYSQNTIGFPDIKNYSNRTYNGGLQNWDIKQDKNGIIYIANNEGLLTFDGKYWKLYPLPNKTIVRSIEIGADNKVYVGGQDEFGYFQPSQNGLLTYYSLVDLIPVKHKSFGDVWDIVLSEGAIFFRSDNKIFNYSNNKVCVFTTATEWSFMGKCNGHLYAQEYNKGLMCFNNGIWNPIKVSSQLPITDPITSMLSVNNDSIWVSTLKNGLFIFTNSNISKIPSTNNNLFESQRIYAATKVNKDWMALATSNGGLYIVDKKGNIIQSFSKKEGLQNNNILSVFLDSQSNLWLGLDNGIDLISYNSAIKQINPSFQDASGYTALVHNNNLYLGTANGLYYITLQQTKDLSFSKGEFSSIKNIKGQTWCLADINNQVLLGHHEGAFLIKDFSAQLISSSPGFWNFIPSSTTFPTAQIFVGNYKGLGVFDFKNNQFSSIGNINDFEESSRFIALDADDNIWVSHPYHGVYKLIKKNNGQFQKHIYTTANGLPSNLNNHVYKIRNEVVVATEKGIYVYDASTDKFLPSRFYLKILGEKGIRYLKEDDLGNVWFIHEKKLGVIDFSSKEPVIIYIPELNNKLLSGFDFIYPVNQNNIFLGGEKGFYHINFEKYKQIIPKTPVQIRVVKIIDNTDSILFGGYFKDVNEKQVQETKKLPRVKHGWKALHFEFSSSFYGNESNLEYSYRLKGFDDNWCNWTNQTEKEYTNLPSGDYTFEVKVRNNLGQESEMASYKFKILPPWYLTIWAKILYLIAFITFNFYLYKWQKNKFKLQQERHEQEQKKMLYIHELELNKTESEIVRLKNEKLESDIDFKNSELASSAMHLVKKGELLTKIKGELTQIARAYDNPQATAEIKKLLKSLAEDENIDNEWEAFSKHFDKVHNNFLIALKEKHPNITPTELKLSAYLNMNLSTKEIAQLLNISVRGVEISRYRLRKKLQIGTEINLVDYMMSIEQRSNK